jgi:hypothetical protein
MKKSITFRRIKMNQAPTVGRKVWYRPSEADLVEMKTFNHGDPLDATVVAVVSPQSVNLVIFDAQGFMHRRIAIYLKQEDAPMQTVSSAAYCEWMPYQIAQHNKNREVQIAAIIKD